MGLGVVGMVYVLYIMVYGKKKEPTELVYTPVTETPIIANNKSKTNCNNCGAPYPSKGRVCEYCGTKKIC